MMKHILPILWALLAAFSFAACQETTEEDHEFDNWQTRNETFFKDTLDFAKRQIEQAKAKYPKDWESHCDWRVLPTYLTGEGSTTTWKDSVAVRIIERGTGSGSPLYTDSVRVVYAGRLMPSQKYPEGYIFDHTGSGRTIAEIMDSRFETVATFRVSNVVEGWTTTLQHMHIGDYWRVFIPANMAYGSGGTTGIPGHSTLVFDMRLRAYYRIGTKPDTWKMPLK